MVQKKVEYVLTTSHENAVRGFKKVRDSISQTNHKIREMQILGRGVENVNKQVNKLASANERILGATRGSDYYKNLTNLNKQASKGAEEFKEYGREVGTFNKEIKDMSTLSKISSRDVRMMTSDFNRFASGIKAFENFGPRFVQERAATGKFTGRNWAAFRHADDPSNNIPGSPRLMATPAAQTETASLQFNKLSGQMDYFAENLSNMNQEAADVAKVFGDTTLVTSKFKDVLNAFAKPNLINIEKMAKGPMAGKYGLRGPTGEMIPGTPGFDTEQEAQRFVSVVGNMRESMEKTVKSQEQQQRRQGISFTNLLGLMVKFGVAMQLIEAPGKVLQEVGRIMDQAVDFEHEIAKMSTFIEELRDSPEKRRAAGIEIASIAAMTRVTDDKAVMALAGLATESASALENIPPSPARTIQGVEMGAEISTLMDILERSIIVSHAAASEDFAGITKAYARTQAAYGLSVAEMVPFERQFVATLDPGDIPRASQLADLQGELAGHLASMYGTEDKALIEEKNRDWLSIIATASITQSPELVGTGVRNIFQNILKRPKEVREDLVKLRDKSLANPNMEMIDLTIGAMYRDPIGYFTDLEKSIGPQGILTENYLKSSKGKADYAAAMEAWNDEALAEKQVRENFYSAQLAYISGSVRGARTVRAALINQGKNLEETSRKIDEMVETDIVGKRSGIVMGTTKSMEAERASRKTANEVAMIGTGDLERKIGVIGRAEQDIYRKYGQSAESQIRIEARRLNPLTWHKNPLTSYPMLAAQDAENVVKALEAGVKPAGLYDYLTSGKKDPTTGDHIGLYPNAKIPGLLDAGEDTVRLFFAFMEELSGGPNIPKLFGAGPNSLDFLRTYLEENPPTNAGVSSGQVSVDEINLYISLTGSGVSTEEDGKTIGDEVVATLGELFELESYSGSEISTLYRNDAYESGTFN